MLEEFFSGYDDEGFDEPEAVRGDQPIGPASRVKRQYALRGSPYGGSPVVQTLAYAVRPEHPVPLDSAVAIFMTWTDIAANDKLFDLADRTAPTLRLKPKGES